jgi:transcriptional regulator with XRE-family HTH domain
MTNNIFQQVGNNIQDVLREKGKTQQYLADTLNISKQVMSKIVMGAKAINVSEVSKIAFILGVSVERLLDVKEELLKASNIISTVFLMEQSQDDVNNLVEVLKRVQSTLKDIEPQQYDLLVNRFVNIVARGMGKEDADKVNSIIKDSKEGISMVSNIELLLKKESRKNRELGRTEGIMMTAGNLLIAGVDIEIIAKCTGLSKDELKEINSRNMERDIKRYEWEINMDNVDKIKKRMLENKDVMSMANDIELLIRAGLENSRELGKVEGVMTTAGNLLIAEVDIGIIEKCTGFTEDEINNYINAYI